MIGGWRLIVVLVVIMVGAGVGSGEVTGSIIRDSINASNAQQRHRLFDAQVAGCFKQNTRQAALNKNTEDSWRVDTFFANALTRPNPKATAAEQQLVAKFRADLEAAIASFSWVPLNHTCSTVPTAVQLPVFFSVRLPTAVDLPTAQLTPMPPGS